MAEAEKKTITVKLPSIKIKNPWMILTVILVLLLIVSIIGWPVDFRNITGGFISIFGSRAGSALGSQQVGQKVLSFLNDNLVQAGTSASLVSVEDLGSLYKITSSYQDQEVPVYSTKDGKYLILQQGLIDMTQEIPTQNEQPQEIPKTDKPTVQLFVMSFCPYGIQAEQIMKPVVDLLGNKATIEPQFIVSVSGTTVNSLHGDYEAKEDMRQACIWKDYGQTIFWKYVDYVNGNCNSDNIDTCWKTAATNASIDVSKVETCVTNEGLNLMKEEETLANQNGVSGSPTLLINGALYSGARTPEDFKQAICSAFNTPPSECSQTLGTSGGTASGGCAS